MMSGNYGSGRTSDILNTREETHGDFVTPCRISRRLKDVIYAELMHRGVRRQEMPADYALEALDMICHKIARIIAGRWDFPDHWDDISGYATQVSLRCPQLTNPKDFTGIKAPPDARIRVSWGEDPGDSLPDRA